MEHSSRIYPYIPRNIRVNTKESYSSEALLFSVFIIDLLKEIEQAEIRIQLSSGKTIGGILLLMIL